jgi:hypothetical protein
MLAEMRFDLTLGLDDKAEAEPIADKARCGTDRVGACVPQRIEQARPAVELLQTFAAPREMIGFLGRGSEHARALRVVVRDRGLTEIQRLRAHFADVIDTHEPGRVTARRIVERNVVDVAGGRRPHRNRRGFEDRAECSFDFDEGAVERRERARVHGFAFSNCCASNASGCRTGIAAPR